MLRRGKLVWESTALNIMCDRCHRPRTVGDHEACSQDRKRARSLETLAAVKRELLEMIEQKGQ